MRVVVADTSPLNCLVLTGTIGLLPQLFGQVIAPDIVRLELLHPEAPGPVRAWAAMWPDWLVVMPALTSAGDDLAFLDAGERAAIALAESLNRTFC